MSDEESPTPGAPPAPAPTPAAPPAPARDERPREDRPRPSGRPDDRGASRSRGSWSVKARLRSAARRKARKGKKKGMFQRRKVCRFCADKNLAIDYKEAKTLRLFISETGKMTPRRISGTCAKHQRKLAVAIKRARQIALLPYASSHI
jgi:small subunit ribosomal protein S18